MNESRWMERPLEDERTRLAFMTKAERDEQIRRLNDRTMNEDEVLYTLYTIQDAFSRNEEERERFVKLAGSFLTVEGVEQVLALFLFEQGQSYPLYLALRTASPYLPYGLAVKLDEAATVLARQTTQHTRTAAEESILTPETVGQTDVDWLTLFRTGTYEQQFAKLRGVILDDIPELKNYFCTSYAVGRDVTHQSLIVMHTVLGQLVADDACFPLRMCIERLQIDVTFDSALQLNALLTKQQEQLEARQDLLFSLKHLDPFRALLILSWHQMLHPVQAVDLFEPSPGEVIDALDELTGLTFEQREPRKHLGRLARMLYDSAHRMLEEGKSYEKTAI
ncbi:hypothetical protein [Exiguobacterium oxidotolerans]|uniref:hypothetical protein n=1 Tax=Exiguobacterium oxidotolerans TaxID=223958 RepID=UPI0004945EC0|nr:hypothetical protein [Exiguobacterium oxidotolerans]